MVEIEVEVLLLWRLAFDTGMAWILYILVYMYAYIYIYIYSCFYPYIHRYIYIYIYIFVYIYVATHIHFYIYTYISSQRRNYSYTLQFRIFVFISQNLMLVWFKIFLYVNNHKKLNFQINKFDRQIMHNRKRQNYSYSRIYRFKLIDSHK